MTFHLRFALSRSRFANMGHLTFWRKSHRPYISACVGGQAQVRGCDNVLHSLPFDAGGKRGHTLRKQNQRKPEESNVAKNLQGGLANNRCTRGFAVPDGCLIGTASRQSAQHQER